MNCPIYVSVVSAGYWMSLCNMQKSMMDRSGFLCSSLCHVSKFGFTESQATPKYGTAVGSSPGFNSALVDPGCGKEKIKSMV